MVWFWLVVIAIIILIVSSVVANRYYKKATREVALIRTGAGGQKIALEGGFLALPIRHKVSEINMKTTKLQIERLGPKSVITLDRLRVDLAAEFYVRVDPSKDGVTLAAQALGSKLFRSAELAEMLEGKLVNALLTVSAKYTMDSLQDNRGEFSSEITEILSPELQKNGLLLETVAITRLDQTPFHALDENNVFNALGMRRLADVISTNKKERASIEADAEISVRQTQLEATKQRLVIEQEEEEASLAKHKAVESSRARNQAEIVEEQANAEKRQDEARIGRELETSKIEVAKAVELEKLRLNKDLTVETTKFDNSVALSKKQISELNSKIEVRKAQAHEVLAEEEIKSGKEKEIARRLKDVAVIKAEEDALVDDIRVASETGTVVSVAEAEAQALKLKSNAKKEELKSRAEGEAALYEAQNSQSDKIIKFNLGKQKLSILPDVVEKMLKPTEKIEGIRINQISGFSGNRKNDIEEGGSNSSVNKMVDGVLDLALQLPAVKKIGEEIGLNIADGIDGISSALEHNEDEKENESEANKTKGE